MNPETYLVLRFPSKKSDRQFDLLRHTGRSDGMLGGSAPSPAPTGEFQIDAVELKEHELRESKSSKPFSGPWTVALRSSICLSASTSAVWSDN